MKSTIYLETSVNCYLAAPPSRDLLTAAHQQVTHLWWHSRRSSFELFVSQLVLDECLAGDPDAAAKRALLLADIPLLNIDSEATTLAQHLVRRVQLPERAVVDALHIAVAVRHGIDYLLTWNCRHIANMNKARHLDMVNQRLGLGSPRLVTPHLLQPWEGPE